MKQDGTVTWNSESLFFLQQDNIDNLSFNFIKYISTKGLEEKNTVSLLI